MIHPIGPKTHVSGRFGPFRYRTKVDAKLAELAPSSPKFAKRSCVVIFATSAPNRPHSTQNSSFGWFGPFRYRTKHDAELAELVPLTHKYAKQIHVRIFRNERTRSTPLDPKLMFCDVSDHFVTA
jgi:hypothetical protein